MFGSIGQRTAGKNDAFGDMETFLLEMARLKVKGFAFITGDKTNSYHTNYTKL